MMLSNSLFVDSSKPFIQVSLYMLATIANVLRGPIRRGLRGRVWEAIRENRGRSCGHTRRNATGLTRKQGGIQRKVELPGASLASGTASGRRALQFQPGAIEAPGAVGGAGP